MNSETASAVPVTFMAPSAPTWAAFVYDEGDVRWERVHLWCCRAMARAWNEHGLIYDPFNAAVVGMTSYGPGLGYGSLCEINQDDESFLGYFCQRNPQSEDFTEMLAAKQGKPATTAAEGAP